MDQTYEEYIESTQNSIQSLDQQMDQVWAARDGAKSTDENFINRTYEVQQIRDLLEAETGRLMSDAPNWQMYKPQVDSLHNQYSAGVGELFGQL